MGADMSLYGRLYATERALGSIGVVVVGDKVQVAVQERQDSGQKTEDKTKRQTEGEEAVVSHAWCSCSSRAVKQSNVTPGLWCCCSSTTHAYLASAALLLLLLPCPPVTPSLWCQPVGKCVNARSATKAANANRTEQMRPQRVGQRLTSAVSAATGCRKCKFSQSVAPIRCCTRAGVVFVCTTPPAAVQCTLFPVKTHVRLHTKAQRTTLLHVAHPATHTPTKHTRCFTNTRIHPMPAHQAQHTLRHHSTQHTHTHTPVALLRRPWAA